MSRVKSRNMWHLWHHGTELLLCIFVDMFAVQYCNICHLQHHGTELLVAICVENSVIKRYNACHSDHYLVPSFCAVVLLTCRE